MKFIEADWLISKIKEKLANNLSNNLTNDDFLEIVSTTVNEFIDCAKSDIKALCHYVASCECPEEYFSDDCDEWGDAGCGQCYLNGEVQIEEFVENFFNL